MNELERRVVEAAERWALAPTGSQEEDSAESDLYRCVLALRAADGATSTVTWVTRTWADVRQGDTVRMPGTEQTTTVFDRYWPPVSASGVSAGLRPRFAGSWHMVAGEKHWDDRVVRPGECCVVIVSADATPRFMNPAAPVEIMMTDEELEAIQLLGSWDERVKVVTTK